MLGISLTMSEVRRGGKGEQVARPEAHGIADGASIEVRTLLKLSVSSFASMARNDLRESRLMD